VASIHKNRSDATAASSQELHDRNAAHNQARRQHHIRLIGVAWQKGVESIIETGRLLIAAKDEIAHGEFVAMIENELPFAPRTAERLMAVASNRILSNPTHVSHLPPAWSTLYELSQIDDVTLLKKIKAGEITPRMERKDVVTMKAAAALEFFAKYEPAAVIPTEAVPATTPNITTPSSVCAPKVKKVIPAPPANLGQPIGSGSALKNHRDWAKHYAEMVEGINLMLIMPACDTPAEDTAALERVLKIFEEARDHHTREYRNGGGT
jgi:hypothetical protein